MEMEMGVIGAEEGVRREMASRLWKVEEKVGDVAGRARAERDGGDEVKQ